MTEAQRLRWGILSTANIARRKVVPGMRSSARSEVVAVGSRDLEAAQQRRGRARHPAGHGSYEALLADPDIEAIYIPLPNHMHLEWTLAAARAGKHVLCEKPIALCAAEAERMVEGGATAGVRLMEAFMYRHHPRGSGSGSLVAAGRIGRLQRVQSCSPITTTTPEHPQHRRRRRRRPADIGCYSINLSRMLFGAEPGGSRHRSCATPTAIDVLTSGLLTSVAARRPSPAPRAPRATSE